MRPSRLAAAGALVLTGFAATLPQEDLRAALGAAQKELKAHAGVIQAQDAALKDLERRVVAVEGWFRGVPVAAGALETGLKDTEAGGFADAGANPRAREILLATLRNLAANLKAGLPSAAVAAK